MAALVIKVYYIASTQRRSKGDNIKERGPDIYREKSRNWRKHTQQLWEELTVENTTIVWKKWGEVGRNPH